MSDKKSTAVAKASPIYGLAAKYNLEPTKFLEVIRATCLKPGKKGLIATNEEMAAFCVICERYNLDPFTKEIHGYVTEDRGVVIIVGIDGWTRIVNRNPEFNGCDFEEVPFDEEGKMPKSITCTMHVKGREHPIVVTERYSECHRDTKPWGQMPWRMLRHKAFMQAARYAFSLGGIYDEDEAADILAGMPATREPVTMPRAIGEDLLPSTPADQQQTPAPPVDAQPAQQSAAADGEEPITEALHGEITKLFKKAGWEPQVITSFLAKWQVPNIGSLTLAQGKEVVSQLLAAVGKK